jgi:hypothetical protein
MDTIVDGGGARVNLTNPSLITLTLYSNVVLKKIIKE